MTRNKKILNVLSIFAFLFVAILLPASLLVIQKTQERHLIENPITVRGQLVDNIVASDSYANVQRCDGTFGYYKLTYIKLLPCE